MAQIFPTIGKQSPFRQRVTRSWLRVTTLESRVTPTVFLPDFVVSPPSSSPELKSNIDRFVIPNVTSTVAPNAPIISEWTRSAKVNESIAITGHELSAYPTGTDFGKDSEFLIYGQTKDGTQFDGTLTNGQILRLDGPRAAVTLPSDLLDSPGAMPPPAGSIGSGCHGRQLWDGHANGSLISPS
jgi:hypothetical protein